MAVDVQEITSSYEQEMRRARTEVLQTFHRVLKETLEADPGQRDAVLDELREYRTRYRDAGRADMEDLILDAMDMLTGWSARAVRV